MHHNLSAIPGERRVLPGRSVQVHCRSLSVYMISIMSAKPKVTKTKAALRQETHYNLSDLKHDLHCGFVELGDSASESQVSCAVTGP